MSRSRAAILRHFATRIYGQNGPRFADTPPPAMDMARLRRDIAYYDYRADWLAKPLTRRLAVLARLDSVEEFRWAVPRVLGASGLFAFKKLKRKLIRGPTHQHQGSTAS